MNLKKPHRVYTFKCNTTIYPKIHVNFTLLNITFLETRGVWGVWRGVIDSYYLYKKNS